MGMFIARYTLDGDIEIMRAGQVWCSTGHYDADGDEWVRPVDSILAETQDFLRLTPWKDDPGTGDSTAVVTDDDVFLDAAVEFLLAEGHDLTDVSGCVDALDLTSEVVSAADMAALRACLATS